MLLRVGKCERMNLHTPKWAPALRVGVLMELWIFREWLQGSNPLNWRITYIIVNLLKLRCLKWACMTHLDTKNTSYGQKNGQKSNYQFDSWPLKANNRSNFLACKWHATYYWEFLDKGYNFALDLISIGSLLIGPQNGGSLSCGNFKTPTCESWDKMTFRC
jgi:hypothetical protein